MKEKSVREEAPAPDGLKESGFSFSLAVGLVMLLSLVLTLIAGACGADGSNQPDWLRYVSYLLPQLCFAAAAVVWFRRGKTHPRTVYRPCKWYCFPLALVLQFGLLFSLGELNSFLVELLAKAGYTESGAGLTETMLRGWYLLPTLLVAAVLPALFEETVFRGALALGVKKEGWGTGSAVLITGALFALMHGSPEQTVYQFACGACFALLAVHADSILPGMLAHLANNAVIIVLSACGINSFFASLPLAGYVVLVVLAALVLCGCILFFALTERKRAREEKPFAARGGKRFFLAAAIGIGLCALQWIMVLVTGFSGV